jgi:FMN reductase (NADPH)
MEEMNEVIRLLQNHRSIRKFTEQKLSQEQVEAIIRSAQMASTSSNVQAYSIIGVTDSSMKKELARLAGDQKYVEECPLFLVFCADLHRIQVACRMREQEMVYQLMEPFIVATVDAALAAQNAMVAAESMGLGGVYIGGIRNQPAEVSALLRLPKLVYPVFGMCIGYPAQDPILRPRMRMQAVYHENTYDAEKYVQEIEHYDQVTKDYYDRRTNGKMQTTWSEQMAERFSKPVRAHMRAFLEEQGFRFD